MKALSLIQPWATLVAVGAKRYETRSWSTSYRGPIAIHASKWLDAGGKIISKDVADYLALCHQEPFRSALTQNGIDRVRDLPSGAVVAIARLVDVVHADTVVIDDLEREFGNFAPGRYAWKFADVRAIAPIPHRGFPGLWDLPDTTLAAVHGGRPQFPLTRVLREGELRNPVPSFPLKKEGEI
jgi:hypothetical protein